MKMLVVVKVWKEVCVTDTDKETSGFKMLLIIWTMRNLLYY
jgi:hypothetical protein